jgi:hypothetical protein
VYNSTIMTTTIIQVRRDTAANWSSNNPTLAQGEIGFETNTSKFKIGNGSSVWSTLPYFSQTQDLSGYLTSTSAASTYLTQASASTIYLTQASASSTYLTQASASSTYLTQSSASNTYATKNSPTFSGTVTIPSNTATPGLIIKSAPETTAIITGFTVSGTVLTYTANNSFVAGDIVNITGISTGPFSTAANFYRIPVATASPTQFTVTIGSGITFGTYASGGIATKIQANLQEWQNSNGGVVASLDQFGQLSTNGLSLLLNISGTANFLTISKVFTSAFENYRIIFKGNDQTSLGIRDLSLSFRDVNEVTANTNYVGGTRAWDVSLGNTAWATGTTSTTSVGLGFVGEKDGRFSGVVVLDVFSPAQAARTTWQGYGLAYNFGLTGTPQAYYYAGQQKTDTVFSGFNIGGGTGAGSLGTNLQVYGYRS